MAREWLKDKSLLLSITLLATSLWAINAIIRSQDFFFCNSNYGFGIFEPKPFFFFLEVVALIGAGYLYTKLNKCADRIIFSILLVAGMANVLERFWYGCVADYITLPIIGSLVNIPDILITGAVGFFLFLQTPKKSL